MRTNETTDYLHQLITDDQQLDQRLFFFTEEHNRSECNQRFVFSAEESEEHELTYKSETSKKLSEGGLTDLGPHPVHQPSEGGGMMINWRRISRP
jgi:hypothetical protein